MLVKQGDTVKVSKFVYDKWYHATGAVQDVHTDTNFHRIFIKVAGDWYEPINDFCNTCKLLTVIDPATMKQIDYMIKLGYDGDISNTMRKSQASDIISMLKSEEM